MTARIGGVLAPYIALMVSVLLLREFKVTDSSAAYLKYSDRFLFMSMNSLFTS